MIIQLLVSFIVFVLGVSAFPGWSQSPTLILERLTEPIQEHRLKPRQAPLITPGFNAAQQHVSTTGDHAFIPPGPNDLRGPCPGLNAMANHGYIPRNGIGTISQFIQGTYDVFGMGIDLATTLSIYGAVYNGDLTSWSIGGAPPPGLLNSVGLLGAPQGISNSHNKYEGDASPTRGDLFQYGNDFKVVLSQFQDLYSQPLGPKGYDIPLLTRFRAHRFQQSIENNPYFFNGPFTGLAVQTGAYTFIYRFMGNKSAEHPDGYLDGETLKSFFAITGESGNFTWTEGYERIPDNWYKRALGDEYTTSFFAADLAAAAVAYPQFLSVGGNTGKTNTFTGVDLGNATGGVYNAQSLADGNKALCFALQAAQQGAPDVLKGSFANVTAALGLLGDAVGKAVTSLGCPQLKAFDSSQLGIFPGSKGSL